MQRRNFIINFILWVLSFVFGYKIGNVDGPHTNIITDDISILGRNEDPNGKLKNLEINVKTFGAKGDGKTDDTQAFQAYADALSSLGGGSYIIPFTSKGYVIQGTVNMPSNVFLSGNKSLILAKTHDNGQTPFKWEDKTDIIIENLRINGFKELKNPKKSVMGGSYGLYFRGDCRRIRIRNCYIFNTLEHGISLGGYVTKIPVFIRRAIDIVIEGNTFENNGNPDWTVGPRGACIMTFYGVRKMKVLNNHFKDCAGTFIYIDSGYADRKTLESRFQGLSVLNGDFMGEDNEIINNTFEVTYDHGKFTDTVTGNGVAVHGQKRCTIANNSFNFPIGKYKSIYVSVGQEYSPTQDIIIIDNKIVSSYIPVSVFQSEKVIIKNNLIRKTSENKSPAILLRYNDSPVGWSSEKKLKLKYIEVSGNTIYSPKYEAISIKNDSRLTTDLSNIIIRQNTIYLSDIKSGYSSGIYANGVCSKVHVLENQIYGGYHGIYFGSSEKIYIRRNYIEGSQRGIVAVSAVTVENNDTVDCVRYDIHLTDADSIAIFNTGDISTATEIKTYIHVNGSNLQLGSETSGSWQRPLQLGKWCLWIDTSGNLRKKNGSPTKESDGSIV